MKKNPLFALMLSAVVLFAGCGAKNAMDYDYAATTSETVTAGGSYDGGEGKYDFAEMETSTAAEEDTVTILNHSVASSRKLIKNVELEMQTLEFEKTMEAIQAEVEACGGYVEGMNLSSGSYYYSSRRSAYFTLRVPAGELGGFTQRLDELGHIAYQSERVEDVTANYVDLESRKAALLTEQEALLSLMEKADNMTDLLEIRSRLTDVNYQLEAMQSKLNRYDDLVAFSTINLSLEEVERVTSSEPMGFWEEAGSRLSDSLYDLKEGAREFAVSLIGSLPFLILWVLILGVLGIIALRLGRRIKGARSKKAAVAVPSAEPKEEPKNEE